MKKLITTTVLILLILFASNIYSQPQPPTLVSPPNGATNVSLFPTFVWNASSGATSYRLQIIEGVNIVFDQQGITSTSYTLSSAVLTYNTSYYWRVNATGPGGTSDWSAQWTFTTQIQAPSPPVLLSPPNNSTNITLTHTLSWSNVSGATYYQLQVSTNSGFTSTVIDINGLVNPGYVVPSGMLNNNTTYYWRVNASNSGGTSNWSTVWNFTTIPAPPPAPNLISPTNGQTNVSVTPNLDWSDVSGASLYTVQVSLNSGFTAIVVNEDVTVSNYSVPSGILSGQTTYYWRVSASNIGGTGPWSTVWSFTTMLAPPAAPILVYPSNGAVAIPLNVTLDWNPSPSATSYRVQVSTNSGFTTTIVNQVTGSTTQYTIPTGVLQNNTTYYWRVNATNAGGTSPWSEVWSFTTIQGVPPPPTLLLPINGATGVSLTPLMDWTDVSGASSYRLQISTTNTFVTTVLNVVVTTGSQYNVPSGTLLGNTQYYWRVASINAGGQGSYSTIFSFVTVQTFNLNLKVFLEGFYNGSTQVQDTVRVYLAQNTSPFTFKDSSNIFLSSNGTGLMSFSKAASGNYYIVVKHRNHVETWSANAMYFNTGSTVNYDFTTSASKAYGNNMKQVGSVWVLYGGDANADGYVDPTDYNIFKTQFGLDGYKGADFNGDNWIDGYDALILYSNFGKSKSRPY
jgi:hypothetical protein